MKLLKALLSSSFAALLIAQAPAALSQEKSRMDDVLKRGHLIVGVTSEAPPFGSVDEKGELVGFDIDIARLIAKAIFRDPNKVEFVRQSFSARWANVQTGRVDFGIQLTAIYPDRAVRVAFTRGYIDSGITLLVRKDSAIKQTSDANSDRITVGQTTSPASTDRAARFFPKAKTLVLDSTSAVVSALRVGRIQAGQFDVPVARFLAKNHPELTVLDDWLTEPANNAIFLAQGDFRWWHLLDTLVGEMRGGSLFGEYSEIYEKWFGAKPAHEKHYIKR